MKQRIIKFRAWDYDEEIMRKNWTRIDVVPSDRVVLMEYTGLKDRNGIDIYEGDIIKTHFPTSRVDPDELIFSVTFEEGSFNCFKMNDKPMTLREVIEISNKKQVSFQGTEIIGNIYENPNLLPTNPTE